MFNQPIIQSVPTGFAAEHDMFALSPKKKQAEKQTQALANTTIIGLTTRRVPTNKTIREYKYSRRRINEAVSTAALSEKTSKDLIANIITANT